MSQPSSSPRLPSPPPPTEIQIGPKSPSLGGFPNTPEGTAEQSIIEANANRRIHAGTKSADMAAGPPLINLSELDSAFQLQEHLKALHYHYSKPSSDSHVIPINRETARLITIQPEGVDRTLWLYELCRFLINKCNDLIIGFLFDDPPCSATTCPEMRASEWQFLCAVHESPKSCCAIDYCCHTLDWATNIVTSQKIFPSRLSLAAGDSLDERGSGVRHLVNIFRRLHRIFAHAWFQHRGVFWSVEGQTGLYVLFKTVCDIYELLPAENYKLPPEAEGLEPVEETRAHAPTILRAEAPVDNTLTSAEEDFVGVGRNNTRRHIRQSPSVGSAVTTVLESDEEDHPGDVTQRLGELQIAEEEGPEEVNNEIPVIVETYEVEDHPEVSVEEANAEPEVHSESWREEVEKETEAEAKSEPESKANSTASWDSLSSDLGPNPGETSHEEVAPGHSVPENSEPDKTDPREPGLEKSEETSEKKTEDSPPAEAKVETKETDES